MNAETIKWPDNKRIAVMMAFDLDAETMWTTHGDGSTAHMTNLSRGAYGPKQGVPRILDMLDVHQVKATFFIPGVIAEKYPLVVKEIARRGHDIGFHGYLHEESTATTYEQEDASYILKQSGQSLSIRSIFAVFGSTGGKLSEKSCRPVSGM